MKIIIILLSIVSVILTIMLSILFIMPPQYFFYSNNCPHCTDEIKVYVKEQYPLALWLNVDNESNKELALSYNLHSIPVVINQSGEILNIE